MSLSQLQLPPLSLYIHVPWCVQKCPYCDFNSHKAKSTIPEQAYVSCLLDDLEQDLAWVQGRKIQSIFIGGGTPSLLSVEAMSRLMDGVRDKLDLAPDCEITMEANPGTIEHGRFAGFAQTGINRISIGVQSLQADKLEKLGRIHGAEEAKAAAQQAQDLNLRSFNLDLMHGLPNQSIDDAISDLEQAIALNPPHISWYQLTIEPNTLFGSNPPTLPQDDTLWEIQHLGHQLLTDSGYQQYEISAYGKPEHRGQHNLNYWRFGDYLGIGCGAHSKITHPESGQIIRCEKIKHPQGYLDLTKPFRFKQWQIAPSEMAFEFFMNRFRLFEPAPKHDFVHYTGLPLSSLDSFVEKAQANQLIVNDNEHWQPTDKGYRYLNELLSLLV